MQAFFKTLASLLLAAVVTAPLAALNFRPDVASHQPPAGCHADGGTVPTPESTSHGCCQGAHHPAIVQSSTLQTSLPESTRVDFLLNPLVPATPSFPTLTSVSGDPPMTSPLRV
jgi:hypothetical protein